MYPISNAVAALFEAEQKQVLRITGTDKNGATINITDECIDIGSFNVDRFSCIGNMLELGTAISSELQFKLNNANGEFDNVVFEGSELFVEIGVADWSQDNPTVTYIPIGYFTPDEQPRKLTTISIFALDRMARFDTIQPSIVPWTDENNNVITDENGNSLYFCADLQLPCTVAELVSQSAMRCFVPFSQDLTSLPNANYMISALPVLQQEITFRNIIQWCAGIMGTCAFIDWNGNLQFKWYNAANYTSTPEKRYFSELYENDITITGVKYTNTQNVSVVSGSPEYALDMTGNYLVDSGIAEILPNVKNVVNGFTYRPFNATVITAPWIWPMDVITFTDKNGNNHSCAVTNVNFGLNANTELAGCGQTEQINSQAKPMGVTQEQGLLIEQALEATRKLDNSLTQEEIFNRLTDNGQNQGLLLYNGKVYLNASYIKTGKLVADLIKGGKLTLGGDEDANGWMQVLDKDGNIRIKITKDGIEIDNPDNRISTYGTYRHNTYETPYFPAEYNGRVLISTWEDSGDKRKAYFSPIKIGLDYIQGNHTPNSAEFSLNGIDVHETVYTGNTGNIVKHFYVNLYSHKMKFTGDMTIDGNVSCGNGASGYFNTTDGKTVTVKNGIITRIS